VIELLFGPAKSIHDFDVGWQRSLLVVDVAEPWEGQGDEEHALFVIDSDRGSNHDGVVSSVSYDWFSECWWGEPLAKGYFVGGLSNSEAYIGFTVGKGCPASCGDDDRRWGLGVDYGEGNLGAEVFEPPSVVDVAENAAVSMKESVVVDAEVSVSTKGVFGSGGQGDGFSAKIDN
jgi:hypothetical protein